MKKIILATAAAIALAACGDADTDTATYETSPERTEVLSESLRADTYVNADADVMAEDSLEEDMDDLEDELDTDIEADLDDVDAEYTYESPDYLPDRK